MSEFSDVPHPDEVLGQGFQAEWQRQFDEWSERAKDIDPTEHFTPEDAARITDELTQLGVADADEFLRMQVIVHADATVDATDPIPLATFTDRTVAGLRDGQYS